MKNKNLCIALAAIIGFAMVACAGDLPLPQDTPDDDPSTFIAVTHITGIPANKKTTVDLPLNGTVQPPDATNKTITWSIASAGTTGATIANDLLKTTAEGTVTLTATVVNGASETTNYTQPFTITVANEPPAFIAVTDITGVPTTTTAGVDLTLIGSVEPSDATHKTIAWSIATTNNLNGATVANGVLKTTTAGTATVTATVANGATTTTNYTKNFTITVTAPPPTFIPVTNITDVLTTVTVGTDLPNLPLGGTVVPSNATNKTITWSIVSAGTTGATITPDGVFKATAAGTATVTATVVNGASATTNYTKNFTITVTSVTTPGGNVPGTPTAPQPFANITATQLVAQIKVGWNLGNTLDAHNLEWLGTNPTVAQLETGWSNPVTTKAMITTIKNAGFNGIRIPVSWKKASDSNYNIRADWMERVVQIVNYAVENDMYIILNTHHDEDIFKFTNAEKTASLAAFEKIWTQIAVTFRNYDEKLIFEGLNEPRTIGSGAEWNGGTSAEHANLNAHYPVFVQAVRASGGNNDKRFLIINPYAASATQTAVSGLTLPADTAPNKLIVSIHAYTPYEFCYTPADSRTSWNSSNSSDTGPIHNAITPAYNKFVSQGIPVIIGEFGAVNKNNLTARVAWAEYYVSYAKGKGIPCFIWDNGSDGSQEGEDFGLFNRSNNTFYFPTIKNALISGANNPISSPGEDGGGEGGGEVIGGNFVIGAYTWNAFNDEENGGTSSITMSATSGGTINVSGNVTDVYQYGFAGWVAKPDAAELARLKTATSISFKVKGDGKTYKIMLPISSVTNYCYHLKTFIATTTETTITVNISEFAQPDWGAQVPLNKSLLEQIQWQTNDNFTGAFSLSISELTLGQ
jgi:endoglucanase